MKKRLLLSICHLMIITFLFSCNCEDTERIPTLPPDEVYMWENGNSYYSIAATSDTPGESCTLKLTYNYNDADLTKKEIVFEAVCPIDFERTHFTLFDLNNDNVKDVILEIPTETNSAAFITKREVYIIDGKSDELIPIDNALEIVNNQIQFSADSGSYYLSINNVIYEVVKSAFDFFPDEAFADQLRLDSAIRWSIDRNNRFYCNIDCIITAPDAEEQYSAGSIYAYYTYENGQLTISDFGFFASRYNEKIIHFETDSDYWKLWYNTNYLVLENADGKQFYFGDTRDTYDVIIPSENAIQFYPVDNTNAKAIINGNYAAIVYEGVRFSANDPVNDHVIIVNLETGLIEKYFYTDSAAILEHNNVEADVILDYEYTEITPIQYYIKADVTKTEDSFVCTFKLLTYDNKVCYHYPMIFKTKEAL